MNLLQNLVDTVTSTAIIQNVGWLLIHSSWQCLLIALMSLCITKAMRCQSSSTRYWMYSLSLSLMVIAPVVTMLAFPPSKAVSTAYDQNIHPTPVELIGDSRQDKVDNGKSIPIVSSQEEPRIAPSVMSEARPIAVSYSDWIEIRLSPWLSTIVAVWCCGVVMFSIRPIWGWLMVRRLLGVGTSPAATHVQEALQRVCEKMQVRWRVELLASSFVGSPVVVGCVRSVILVPASFVSNLPIAQLEAILAHELAHVRRYDYLVNLMQTIVETFFFFHPAVWWISHRIRMERENSCDDLVVSVLNDKVEYGRALLAVEEFRGSATRSALALSARDGSLLRRIRRLLAAPNCSNQRLSAGFAAVATAVTSFTIALAYWSAMSAAQSREDNVPFGEVSRGLRARIVALRPDVNDSAPNMGLHHSDYKNSEQMTFGVELTNIAAEPVTLAGIRYGEGFAKEVRGTPRTTLLGPHWFQFEFIDSTGKLLRRTHREFQRAWQVADNASTHELAPRQSLIEVLRPGKFHSPMNFDLPPGEYKVRVRYHGPDQEFRDNVRKHWPNKPILNAWPHEVVSNTIDFEIAEGSRRIATNLVWGKPVDGLQAAIEYRVTSDSDVDPSKSPGIPVGTPFNVLFHVKNVCDKPITFISETGRQGDKAHVTNERGETVDVKDGWFSGDPIDIAWKLEPREIAQLSLLTPSLSFLDQPGKYKVRYTIRFNSRTQKDDAGKVIFPRPDDYDKEIETGETPLFLAATSIEAVSDLPNSEIRGLKQRWNRLQSGEIEFEVVSRDGENARANVDINPVWLRFCPGTQIVEHTDAKFVSGVVVDEEGRPIAGCSVEHPGIVDSETDDQGRFQYKQSVPHRTVLRTYHPDYRLWHGAPELGDVVRIVLHKKPKVEAVNGTREMTVRVIDSRTAEPVPNVKVTASRYEGPQNGTVAATAVTNQDGSVAMRGLDFIQHKLSLSADKPVSYIGNHAYPGADQHEVIILVDRACELVLRAVDSETGKGVAGVRFDRERALAELWAEPVVSDILGSNQKGDTLTDADGYARFLVGPATWSYMILKYPEGYDSIVPELARPDHFSEEITRGQEAEIPTPVGDKVEHTFRLIKTDHGVTKAHEKQDDDTSQWGPERRPDSIESSSQEKGEILGDNAVQPKTKPPILIDEK